MSNSKMIVLKSSDGEIFEVEEAVAIQSQTIAHMVEDDCVGNGVPLANVTGQILARVIEYCKKHVVVTVDGDSSSSSEEELKNWDAEFIKNMDQSTLFGLILAANFLNIKSLLDLTCQAVADMIENKKPEEIRSISTSRMISLPRKKHRFAKKANGLFNDHVARSLWMT